MSIPEPSKPRPIYNGKVDTPKLFIDGKEVPWFELCEIKYGTVNFETGIVTYYEVKGEQRMNDKEDMKCVMGGHFENSKEVSECIFPKCKMERCFVYQMKILGKESKE